MIDQLQGCVSNHDCSCSKATRAYHQADLGTNSCSASRVDVDVTGANLEVSQLDMGVRVRRGVAECVSWLCFRVSHKALLPVGNSSSQSAGAVRLAQGVPMLDCS